ncbi:MAG: cytochrome c3 family protein [Actinomycetes bacterium]
MKSRRVTLWVAVVTVVAAAIVLASPLLGGAVRALAAAPGPSVDQPLDLTAPTTPGSCAPCHLNIVSGKTPGLIFSHGAHLAFQCVACHPGNPHILPGRGAPPMKVCFNCHGLAHGPQGGIASGTCASCHTKAHDLLPKDHTPAWKGKPHAVVAKKTGVNDCIMCHEAVKTCDPCHVREKVQVGPMPEVYHPVYFAPPQAPPLNVYPNGATTMGQCSPCHPNLDAFAPGKVIFKHSTHLERNYKCTVCHPGFSHQGEKILRPTMQGCYRCHGLDHATSGQVATVQCAKCHPPGFDLKPTNHDVPDFVTGGHSAMALEDAAYCAMCHAMPFCNACHNGVKVAPGMTPGQKVIPKDHRNPNWMQRHGPLFLQGKGLCASCHDSLSCERCHKTPMPHPSNWLTGHQTGGKGNLDCNVCHRNRDACQACHHAGIKNAQLVEATCVRCHPEMKQKPPTDIQNKAFAEHAVHFNVAKKKGAPYTCSDCHVDFGSNAVALNLEKQQGHDLRLCYGCHGASDFQNRRIAPYPGAELCKRCHKSSSF